MSTRSFIVALVCIVLLTALVLFAAVREDVIGAIVYTYEVSE